jgi:hypothetical protein
MLYFIFISKTNTMPQYLNLCKIVLGFYLNLQYPGVTHENLDHGNRLIAMVTKQYNNQVYQLVMILVISANMSGQIGISLTIPSSICVTWNIGKAWDPLNMTGKYLDIGCYLRLKDV